MSFFKAFINRLLPNDNSEINIEKIEFWSKKNNNRYSQGRFLGYYRNMIRKDSKKGLKKFLNLEYEIWHFWCLKRPRNNNLTPFWNPKILWLNLFYMPILDRFWYLFLFIFQRNFVEIQRHLYFFKSDFFRTDQIEIIRSNILAKKPQIWKLTRKDNLKLAIKIVEWTKNGIFLLFNK